MAYNYVFYYFYAKQGKWIEVNILTLNLFPPLSANWRREGDQGGEFMGIRVGLSRPNFAGKF